jgi:2-dehydropantoate 2-reductase
MRILVMGAGAVGGYFGAVLSRGGQEVTLVARGRHLEAIKRDGLRVESVASGDFTVRPPAIERPDGTWKADLVLYCVKSYDNPDATAAMGPAVGDDTTVLTLQNGIGSGDELSSVFGSEKVLLGVTYIDAAVRRPGVVSEVGGPCNIVFGEQNGRVTPRVPAVRNALEAAGVDVRLSSDIVKELWNKLIYACALSGMTCVTRASFAEVLKTPATFELTLRVMREAEAVGRARGVDLDDGIVETTMASFQQAEGVAISSMQADLERGRPLEIGVLNGAIARTGRELGIATPVNEFISGCLTPAHDRALSKRD